MKTRITLLVFSFLQTICLASYYDEYVGKIVPQTPQTAQLLKYGNYPVDHSSGLVQIDIPLYTIEYDGVTVPISISYHASGIKVDELASVVGLGWTLNAGGVIGRNIMGSSDYWSGLAKQHNNSSRFNYHSADEVQRSLSTLYRCDISDRHGCGLADQICDTITGMMGNDSYDSQSDRYSYSFGNNRGSFRYDVGQDTLVLLPYKPLSIVREDIKPFGFRVIDETGTIYLFREEDVSSSTTEVKCDLLGTKWSNSFATETTGWFLTHIITPNRKDTIYFEYGSELTSGLLTHPSQQCHEGKWWKSEYNDGHMCWNESYSFCTDLVLQHNSFVTPVLKSIRWANCRVDFYYDEDRPEKHCKLSSIFTTLWRLAKLEVRNSKNELVKTVVFHKDCLGTGNYNQRLLLSGLTLFGKEEQDAERYSFVYNKTLELPDYVCLNGGNRNLYCTSDYWGYYNGNKMSSFFPKGVINNFSDREPDYTYAQAGILQSVTYPTGGSTEFIYEGNYDGESEGGLRIKETVDRIDGKIKRRNVYTYYTSDYLQSIRLSELYQYGTYYVFESTDNGAGSGFVWLDNKEEDAVCYNSEACSPQSALHGNSIFYTRVIKEVFNSEGNLEACTEYEYEPDHKRIEREDIPDAPSSDLEPRFYSEEKNYDYGVVNPLLVSQKDYRYENGQRILEHTVENRYELVRTENEPIVGVAVFADFSTVVYDVPPTTHTWHPFSNPADFASYIFAFNVYGVPHYKRLVSTTEEENGLRTQTTYTYDSGFTTLRPLSVKTSRPGCSDVEKRYTYAFQSDDPVLKSMARDNYVDLIVGERVLEGGVVSSRSGDIYKMENGRYLLAEKQYAVGNNPLETRLKMASHDTQGNVTEIVRDGDSHVFLVWGYNYQYPIMKIECPVGKDADCREYLRNKVEAIGASIVPDEKSVKEIRDYMEGKGSLVVTYQYKPLVGLTEVTDEKGIRTFYKYDNQNRLSAIYDAAGRMIESYKYNYKK